MSAADTRPDVLAAIRSCRLWRTASDEAVAVLAGRASVRDVARGASLAREGESADEFCVIVSGKARVFYLGADGRQITFETAESGDPVAAVAAIAGARYPANVEAATQATIACIPTEALFDLLATEPQAYATGKNVRQVVLDLGLLSAEKLDEVLRPEGLVSPAG